MDCIVGIVNYGIAGNVYSIKNAIERVGGTVFVINKPVDFKCVDKIILPGVGSFKAAMTELKNDGFVKILQKTDKLTLGICLGMQVLSRVGFEYGETEGLSLVNAEVKPIICNATIPHVGFNQIHIVKSNDLLDGFDNEKFYFMHSYEMVNYTEVSALTDYSGHQFVSAVHKNNFYGVQFHPEKSREAGLALFKKFIEL